MRRLHVSTRVQLACAGIVATTLTGAVLSLGQFAATAVSVSNATAEFAERQSERNAASSQLASLQGEVEAVKSAARAEVTRLEARQAFLAAILSGEGDPEKLASLIPAPQRAKTEAASDLISMFGKIDQEQLAMAGTLRATTDARYAQTAGAVSKLGLSPARVMGGMGGPYEPVPSGAVAASQATVSGKADPQFRALFNSWKRLDQVENTLVSIPSDKPVQMATVNSGFGVRSDPFRGGRAMHAGVDMPGPYGTPIYATADAVVGRTGWVGGYGNLIELEHGKGIQTRYGHLSSILVGPGVAVKRGQQIGLMGSTGRSTGNHLHYEVRIDGQAVNPIPFLQSTDYLASLQQRQSAAAVGGPVEGKNQTASK